MAGERASSSTSLSKRLSQTGGRGSMLLIQESRAHRASHERGGACEAGGGVLRRRNQPLQFMAAGFVFCPAAASACRLSLPGSSKRVSAAPTHNPQRILRIRRNQPLQFMAAGFVFCPAAASACRLSLPAAASACRLSLPAAGGSGHCPVIAWRFAACARPAPRPRRADPGTSRPARRRSAWSARPAPPRRFS